ncbi:MAG: hypothetical protein J5J00_04625 [Deltaproteobacteria bacterium]|nr:hypothetical protein [Deltaproteobacteria bacterium]
MKILRRLKKQSGIYIVATVAVVVALIALAILVVGVGYRAGDKVLLQNIANLLSLGAMEAYSTSTSQVYSDKVAAGIARANVLVQRNTIKGISSSGLAEVGYAGEGKDGGDIEFGLWHEKYTAAEPCGSDPKNYPCFIRNESPLAITAPNPSANAVFLRLRNPSTNPIVAPLVGNLGTVEVESYAIMVPRCLANLMDLSYSVVQQTHPACEGKCYSLTGGNPQAVPTHPDYRRQGFFAYSGFVNSALDCSNLAPYTDFPALTNLYSAIYWCSMPQLRSSDPTNGTNPRYFFREDFDFEDRPGGGYMIDKVRTPQPFATYLSAMNGALRLIKQTSTQGDKAMLAGFTGLKDFRARVPGTKPDGTDEPDTLTNEIDYLIQLTNPNNILSPKVYPNFLNAGLIPIYSRDQNESGTNLVAAIFNAAQSIADRSQCEEIAKKSIIVATDGMATCGPIAGHTDPKTKEELGAVLYSCDAADYTRYSTQEALLLGILKDYLIENKIAVSFLMDSNIINPHFLDISKNPDPSSGGPYYTLDELRLRGYGIHSTKPLFETQATCGGVNCTDAEAYEGIGTGGENFTFPRPLATLGQLALETGGVICPLLQQCAPSDCPACTGGCYDSAKKDGGYPTLKDCARQHNRVQTCSYIDGNKTQQAAYCATKAVGGNPFALREPAFVTGP